MYTHQLIELLKTFSEKELMKLFKFLNSPYFNNSKRIIALFQILKKNYPEFESRSFTRENIFKSIYKKAEYNDSTFRNLMSDLLKLTLKFVMLEGLEKKEVESYFYITQELFSRGNIDLFKIKMDSIDKILNDTENHDSDYFHNRYRAETDHFYVNLLTNKVLKKQIVITESEKLINGLVSFLNYFVLESIKHNDNLLNYSRTYNIKENINKVNQFIEVLNFENMIRYLKDNSSDEFQIVELYYNLLKAFANFEEEKYYFNFKDSLFKCSEHLGLNDNNFLHSRLINYCVIKINLGINSHFDLNEEIFELYQIYVKNEFYKTISNNNLPFDVYRNVLLNCITTKKLKEMEEFIKVYSEKLLPKHMDSIVNYSYALLYFEKKQFNKAMTCLNKIKFDQFVLKIDMKNLQLKLAYELEHFESVVSMIDSYKHFLKNNTLLSVTRKVMHNNFLNYVSKLVQYQFGSSKVNIPYIFNQLEKSKEVFDKGWLGEKIKLIL
jgi:hypothetical protein